MATRKSRVHINYFRMQWICANFCSDLSLKEGRGKKKKHKKKQANKHTQ